MIFGRDEKFWEEIKGIYTATEIRQQPKLWRETVKIIENNKDNIRKFFKKYLENDTRIVLTGAGTSDYVGDSIVLYLNKLLKNRVEAIATTDLVSNPYDFIEENTKTLLVSFARSGNSPESLGAYNIFQENIKCISQLVITCNEEGELAKKAEKNDNTLCILMPKEANDKSFAMTSSFSCMLLAAILIFDLDNIEENKKHIDIVANQGDNILENKWQDVNRLVDFNCKRVVYLGSGNLKGLCQEMALKNLELTSGKIITVCESVLGFRHGPKSIIDDETLVIIMSSVNEHTKLYDRDLAKEIYGDLGNHKLGIITYTEDLTLKENCAEYININGQDVPEIFTLFNYMLFGQIFGLLSSINLKISPDNPRPDGTVNRVVKGVIIHKYN